MSLKWESLEQDPRQDVWGSWPGAVLLDDEIKFYSTQTDYPLIAPFDEENLKPARYQLTLGNEARLGGRTVRVDKNNPLIIPPHQVAIVRTQETLNLPRFLIARWNLTVGMVYRGLLWVGALQVDPGWVGYLPCPLYNLSNDNVIIEFGEKLFTIDFVRTTRFADGKNLKYPDKSPLPAINPKIQSYDENHLRSGPYEALRELEELRRFRDFAFWAIALMFVVLGTMVAALAVVAVEPNVEVSERLLSFWPLAALVFSAGSFLLSLWAICQVYRKSKKQ